MEAHRRPSDRAIRYILAVILLFAGLRLLLRWKIWPGLTTLVTSPLNRGTVRRAHNGSAST